jgi:hypothetical protein
LRTLTDGDNRPQADPGERAASAIHADHGPPNLTLKSTALDTIAERLLEMRLDGVSLEVVVKLGRPEPYETGDHWKCPYEVWFGDSCKAMAMHGEDAMQALQLSIATLDCELQFMARRRGGVLFHLDEPFNSMLEGSGLQVKSADGSAPLRND